METKTTTPAEIANRDALVQKLVDKVDIVKNSLCDVADVAAEMGEKDETIAMLVGVALLAAAEPLAILQGSAKKALRISREESAPVDKSKVN